jgi:hypothetical protein
VSWLVGVLKPVYELFVDDGALTLWICVWLVVVWFVLPHVIANETIRALVLFAGLIVLLLDSVRRASVRTGV